MQQWRNLKCMSFVRSRLLLLLLLLHMKWASQSAEWENQSGQMQLGNQTVSQQKDMLINVSRKPKQEPNSLSIPVSHVQADFWATYINRSFPCSTSYTGSDRLVTWGYILQVPLKWWVEISWTPTTYYSTDSSVTMRGQFSRIIARMWGHTGITPIFPHESLSWASGVRFLIRDIEVI